MDGFAPVKESIWANCRSSPLPLYPKSYPKIYSRPPVLASLSSPLPSPVYHTVFCLLTPLTTFTELVHPQLQQTSPGKLQPTPVRERGRLTIHLHTSSSAPPKPMPQSHNQVCRRPPAVASLLSLFTSAKHHKYLPLQISFSPFIVIYPSTTTTRYSWEICRPLQPRSKQVNCKYPPLPQLLQIQPPSLIPSTLADHSSLSPCSQIPGH